MNGDFEIAGVYGRKILDSRGNPALEVEVRLEGGAVGRASAPSGVPAGGCGAAGQPDGFYSREKGVKKAVEYVNTVIAETLLFEDAFQQSVIDRLLQEAAGGESQAGLGANAALGASLAVARACAAQQGIPLYRYLGGANARTMPVPMMNMLSGGVYEDNTVDFQEFMILPVGAKTFSDRVKICSEVYHTLKRLLKTSGFATSVGDEGGFAPDLKHAAEALKYMEEAVRLSGREPGRDVRFAINAAAGRLFDPGTGQYLFPGESLMTGTPVSRTTEEMVEYFRRLAEDFPICSIEDGLHEEDWEGWRLLTRELGDRIQLTGGGLFKSDTGRMERGVREGCANAVLVKTDQAQTLTKSLEVIEKAKNAGYQIVISHRGGETEDAFIADLAVAVNSGWIKAGAPCRSERVAKYNQLMRIEEELSEKGGV
ncbi:MAG: phosphopyruvate hydratase [Eubacteriales bacterium]|nr:phosphopyruvate hydratase [Eubacteriales bacterium]